MTSSKQFIHVELDAMKFDNELPTPVKRLCIANIFVLIVTIYLNFVQLIVSVYNWKHDYSF